MSNNARGFIKRKTLILAFPTSFTDVDDNIDTKNGYYKEGRTWFCRSATRLYILCSDKNLISTRGHENRLVTASSIKVDYTDSTDGKEVFVYANPLMETQNIQIEEQIYTKRLKSAITNSYDFNLYPSPTENMVKEEYQTIYDYGWSNPIWLNKVQFNGIIKKIKVGRYINSLKIKSMLSLRELDFSNAYNLSKITIEDALALETLTIPNGVEEVQLYGNVGQCKLKKLYLPQSVKEFSDYSSRYIGNRDYLVKQIEIKECSGTKTSGEKYPFLSIDDNVVCGEVCVHLGNPDTQYELVKKQKCISSGSTPTVRYSRGDTNDDITNGLLLTTMYNSYTKRLAFDNIEHIGSFSFRYMPTLSSKDIDNNGDLKESRQWKYSYNGANIDFNVFGASYDDTPLEIADFSNCNNYVEIGDGAFYADYNHSFPEYRGGLKQVILPKYKKRFGGYVFFGSRITHLDIPETWDNIEDRVFMGMDMLTSVYIPPTIKSIGRNAFDGSQLTEVTIAKDCACGVGAFPRGCTIKYYE